MSMEHEKAVKLLFVGDTSTGKTSIIKRYVNDYFTENYRATQTVDFAIKRIEIEDNAYRLQLWDLAGQDRYQNISRVYYQGAFGAFIVFDSSVEGSLISVKRWKDEIDAKIMLPNGKPLPVFLMANKCDLGENRIEDAEIEKFVQENKCTSAKENINLDSSVRQLLQNILSYSDIWENEQQESSFILSASPTATEDKCC